VRRDRHALRSDGAGLRQRRLPLGRKLFAFSPAALASTSLADGGSPVALRADLQFTNAQAAKYESEWDTSGRFFGDYVYEDLAFDADGDLWVTAAAGGTHVILEFSEAQLEGLLHEDQLGPVVTLLPPGNQTGLAFGGWGALAFDADGNLWAGSSGSLPNLFRFAPASLINGGSPDLSLSVPMNPSVSLAFSPIPSDLPLRP
jgi:hypothetical protein